MKLVYIAHAYGGDPKNLDIADAWVVWASEQGVVPLAPWISFCRRWDETPINREKAFKFNGEAIFKCDEIWLCGGIVSAGMQSELEIAAMFQKPFKRYESMT